jgi:membrane protease YdiL (CAAX protease family)
LPLPAPSQGVPELAASSPWAFKALLALNPLILTTVGVALGAAFAHRVALHSAIAGSRQARLSPMLAVISGIAVAVAIVVVDAAIAPALGDAWASVRGRQDASPILPALLVGALYGGIAEELMMRWGVMSLSAWALLRGFRTRDPAGAVPSSILVCATAVSALAFAAAHLPALSQQVELSLPIVLRTLALNGAAGLVYGWLCWRHSLEAAMLAHATTHVGFAMARAAY